MRAVVVAGVLALAMMGQAKAGIESSYPWLDIGTGPGGYSVKITANVDTITNTGGGGFVLTNASEIDLTLADVTYIRAEMDFASQCEDRTGCVITAPVSIEIQGMAGDLTVFGEGFSEWDGNPAGTSLGFVSGDLSFSPNDGFTDNEQYFVISAVPEPISLSLFVVGLLGLGMVRRRGLKLGQVKKGRPSRSGP